MTDSTFYYIPQRKTTTLSTVGGIDISQTTGIKITSVSNVDITKPGIIAVDWSNPIDDTKIEYITYTSIDGTNELVGVTRGAEDSTGRIHSSGVTVAFVVSASHINEIAKALDGTNSGVTVVSPVVNTGFSGTAKASGSDVATGTNNTKIVTPKALADAGINLSTGWSLANETWTYASASTITVPSGAASKYQVGDKIKWTQTTVKYGVIVAVADTLLTIAVNTDYVVTNAAISANYYSHEANPMGFPSYFSFTVTANGFSNPPTSMTGIYSTVGRMITVSYRMPNNGTSNSTAFSVNLPVTVNGTSSNTYTNQVVGANDNGAYKTNVSCNVISGGTTLIFNLDGGGSNWTASGNKSVTNASITYIF